MDDQKIEVHTKENKLVSLAGLEDWVDRTSREFNLGNKPNEAAAQKIFSTAMLMQETASYASGRLGNGEANEEFLQREGQACLGRLQERAKGMTGDEFISDLSKDCRPLTEVLDHNFGEPNGAELLAMARVYTHGASRGQLENSQVLARMVADKVAVKPDGTKREVAGTPMSMLGGRGNRPANT